MSISPKDHARTKLPPEWQRYTKDAQRALREARKPRRSRLAAMAAAVLLALGVASLAVGISVTLVREGQTPLAVISQQP